VRDGAVLPILHLNGYKIANPTVLARISHEELESLFRGYGYAPHFVEGDDPTVMHELMAATLETVIGEIRDIQAGARRNWFAKRPLWPMIVMRTPKGPLQRDCSVRCKPQSCDVSAVCARGV
jgi:xylulose-5-phosphate/fructose-6-phosphate phosphoketolase